MIIYTNVVNKVLIIEREVNEERVDKEKNQKKRIDQMNLKIRIVKILRVQTRDP